MKKELQELFDGLNKLCAETEAFYFSEQEYGENHIVRSFTYRLASHTDFLKPYARDCRGTAFVLDKRTGEWNLFCRAYKKFANLGEWVSKEITLKERTAEKSFEKLDGCVSGDTIVKVLDKLTNEESIKPISEIVYNLEKYLIYSFNHHINEYEYCPIIDYLVTYSDKKWVEIEIDKSFTIRCTEDHKFLTTDGYIEAKYLDGKRLVNSGC